MLRKELEELFTPEEIDILVKKVSQPTGYKTLPKQEEIDTWCKFVKLHFQRFNAKNYERELFESMVELSTDISRVFDLWEDMVD